MTYKIAFFPSEDKIKLADEVREYMNKRGGKEIIDGEFEYVFVIGGDGSFIYFSKKYFDQKKKIIGIKSGKTSFLSNFSVRDLENLESFDWAPMNCLVLKTQNRTYLASNDICFQGDPLLQAGIEIDGYFLEDFRGSGLLLSTKQGSTAHNKSAGGPILMTKEKSWLLNEIGSFYTNKNNSLGTSLVLSENNSMKINALGKFRVYVDGFVENSLNDQKEFEIYLKEGSIETVDFGVRGYINKLRDTFLMNNV